MTGEGNMKTLLKIELERAFKNKWFYITLCIELVLVIADVCTVAILYTGKGLPDSWGLLLLDGCE